jgi:hypothetical protein
VKKIKREYFILSNKKCSKASPYLLLLLSLAINIAIVKGVNATPSTTFWAPSTPYLQPYGVLHITYDSYFTISNMLPMYIGLTSGILPTKEINLEVGFDFLIPQKDLLSSLILNTKIGTPEDILFKGQPGWSFGIFNLGFKKGVNDYNILYFMLGKTMLEDWGAIKYLGTVQLGAYYGLNKTLLNNEQFGIMAGWFSYPIDIPIIDKIVLAWDIMTGKNHVFGATGGGIYFFISPSVDLLTGPVYFLSKKSAESAGAMSQLIWTLQLDIDIDLKKK